MEESRRRKFLLRGCMLAGLVALLVGAMLTPSLGGSILTKKQAKKTFISKKKANKKFLAKSAAQSQFLSQSQAVRTARATSSSLPGFQSTSTTAVDIPGASASVDVPSGQNGLLVAEFSAASLCTHNTTGGFNCPIQVLVDGQPAEPTPDPNGYLWDTTVVAANSKNRALSLTVSTEVGPGNHTVQVRYGGGVATTTFTLRTWHLLVQSFPG
jgi:hypothetical protein